MQLVRLVVILTLAACGSSEHTTQIDAPSGPPCTGAVYDSCTTNAQCGSMNCHDYMGNMLHVCTQACSASAPCPNDSTGAAVACNMMGNCKPSVANNCHL